MLYELHKQGKTWIQRTMSKELQRANMTPNDEDAIAKEPKAKRWRISPGHKLVAETLKQTAPKHRGTHVAQCGVTKKPPI